MKDKEKIVNKKIGLKKSGKAFVILILFVVFFIAIIAPNIMKKTNAYRINTINSMDYDYSAETMSTGLGLTYKLDVMTSDRINPNVVYTERNFEKWKTTNKDSYEKLRVYIEQMNAYWVAPELPSDEFLEERFIEACNLAVNRTTDLYKTVYIWVLSFGSDDYHNCIIFDAETGFVFYYDTVFPDDMGLGLKSQYTSYDYFEDNRLLATDYMMERYVDDYRTFLSKTLRRYSDKTATNIYYDGSYSEYAGRVAFFLANNICYVDLYLDCFEGKEVYQYDLIHRSTEILDKLPK